MESKNLTRGTQLIQLGRYKEAIPFLQNAIAEDPDNWTGKYHLAICFFDTGEYSKASKLADGLLHDMPNDPDLFFLKAQIALRQDRDEEAMEFVNEAISLYPYSADYFAFKSGLLLNKKKYEEGLRLVNEGLKIDAKNAYCLNIRAQILTKLDRVEEANETVENILFDNPEDSYSHANVGWVELENGNNKKALEHFKEALQFDPNFEYAREGMSTALKSKNFFYRWYLKYSFWIAKQSSKNQWAFIIGIYLVYRVSIKVLSASDMTYLAIPLMIAYLLFALGGWIMEPLSNTILNFDTYGKYLLAKDEKISGYVFGVLLVLGIAAIATFYFLNMEYALVLGVTFICALLPLPRGFLLKSKKARLMGIIYGSIMILTGLIGPFFIDMYTIGIAVFIMMMAYTWIGNFIERQ
ncbi:tetratricopeptide repeat protein [Maribacter algarum]|uniref:Tetratricopeptide repeat protein n=1 Tax=Maribacter algarum (ex Zhang et al. 2020) TaxID=2578118 RepID=A0A5S3PV00_9FLAO|nr:tetratricopeptide repeat protein [Maribacter algarum]TMM58815.1 tetratricopeptide repeat protein [Maribacter algarum]